MLVDPSLFTARYDAYLSAGLKEAGLPPVWVTRDLRAGEEDDLRGVTRLPLFYGLTEGSRRREGGPSKLIKGVEHAVGLLRLQRLVRKHRPYVVHMQWLLLPLLDARALRRIRQSAPLVITVHDALPFNGKSVSRLQRAGFDAALACADRLIVHTSSARDTLMQRGIAGDRIRVVPHGLLGHTGRDRSAARPDGRWRIVQFGKIQGYKGVDLLIEALGHLTEADRSRLQIVIAGEPLIDLAPLRVRAEALGIDGDLLQFRAHYHSDEEVEALVDEADAFIFPYRAIDASGAFLLVADAGKWVIASDLGVFSDLLGRDGEAGALVPAGDIGALAQALTASIGRRPARSITRDVPSWRQIGLMTRRVYEEAAAEWSGRR